MQLVQNHADHDHDLAGQCASAGSEEELTATKEGARTSSSGMAAAKSKAISKTGDAANKTQVIKKGGQQTLKEIAGTSKTNLKEPAPAKQSNAKGATDPAKEGQGKKKAPSDTNASQPKSTSAPGTKPCKDKKRPAPAGPGDTQPAETPGDQPGAKKPKASKPDVSQSSKPKAPASKTKPAQHQDPAAVKPAEQSTWWSGREWVWDNITHGWKEVQRAATADAQAATPPSQGSKAANASEDASVKAATEAALQRATTCDIAGQGADFADADAEQHLTDEQLKARRNHYMRFLRSLRSAVLRLIASRKCVCVCAQWRVHYNCTYIYI